MAANLEAIRDVVEQYVADVKRVMQIDKAVLYGSYAKGDATEHSDVDICFFSDTFDHERSVDIVTDLLGIARKYYKYAYIEPRAFLTSDIDNDNPFVREVLRTGREIK
jgi:predicted nucleotidyltransferase